jgi:hypothetical protein
MAQPGCRARLAHKPGPPNRLGHCNRNNLDGDPAAKSPIPSGVHHRHPAAPEQPLQHVPPCQQPRGAVHPDHANDKVPDQSASQSPPPSSRPTLREPKHHADLPIVVVFSTHLESASLAFSCRHESDSQPSSRRPSPSEPESGDAATKQDVEILKLGYERPPLAFAKTSNDQGFYPRLRVSEGGFVPLPHGPLEAAPTQRRHDCLEIAMGRTRWGSTPKRNHRSVGPGQDCVGGAIHRFHLMGGPATSFPRTGSPRRSREVR